MGERAESLSQFFEDFENGSLPDPEVRRKWLTQSSDGDVKMSADKLSPDMLNEPLWQRYKKGCVAPGSFLPGNEVQTLLKKRQAILQAIGKLEKQVSPAASSVTGNARSGSSAQPIKTPTSSVKGEDTRGQLPVDFENLFGSSQEPVGSARMAMLLILNNPANSTADLYTTLAWCKRQRPNDLFVDYAVTMLADPLPESEIENPVEKDLYEQTAWTRDNFSERRYRALIELRDRLRKSGKLPVAEKVKVSQSSQTGKGGTGPFGAGSGASSSDCDLTKVLLVGGVALLLVAGSVAAYMYVHSAP